MGKITSQETVAAIRRRIPAMIKHVTMWDACLILADEYERRPDTVYRIIRNVSFPDPGYTQPCSRRVCPKCGRKIWVHRFYYGNPREEQHICKLCFTDLSTRKRFSSRDKIEDEKFRCPVCNMGVDTLGKVFPSQAEADLCCGDADRAKDKGGCQPTPGKYIRTRGRLPHGGREGKYIAPPIRGFGSKHMQYGKQDSEQL